MLKPLLACSAVEDAQESSNPTKKSAALKPRRVKFHAKKILGTGTRARRIVM
jgi:hypothetical protein